MRTKTNQLGAGLVDNGTANFRELMVEMRKRAPDEARLVFYVFDLLHQDDVDLTGLPLSERKRDLARPCHKARVPSLKMVETFPDGQVLFDYACKYGFEGVVSQSFRLITYGN
jgi:bifunctional non-homologous end joining protein LigD